MKKTPTLPGVSFEENLARELKNPKFRRAFLARRALHELARAIVQLREAKDMSQGELAELLETAQSSVSRLESGKDTRMPRLDTLTNIADAFGMGLKLVFVEVKKSRGTEEESPVEVPHHLLRKTRKERRTASA